MQIAFSYGQDIFERGLDDMPFTVGEKPGKGSYQCVFSDDRIELDNDKDELPACPNVDCLITHETRWKKIKR